MREAVEISTKFLELLTTIDKTYDALFEEVGKIDKETQDLLHDLEFGTFCGRDGYKKAKRIKEIRMRRRALKNTMELVYPMKECFKNHANLKKELKRTVDRMRSISNEQSSRTYIPRVCTELKTAYKHYTPDEIVAQDIVKRAS